jgi:antitoxin VapB
MSKRAPKTTKAFKSGNSIAVRLPASFGVKEGTEMRVREELGRYIVEPVNSGEQDRPRLRDLIGRCPGAKPAARLEIELRPIDWERKRLMRG